MIALATGNPALGPIQIAAQQALQHAWSLLLPTAKERASALTTLLHRGDEYGTSKTDLNLVIKNFIILFCDFLGGGRFMADLLVTSLMADGGLEFALEQSLSGIK